MARRLRDATDEHPEQSNSAIRAELIQKACDWLSVKEAERKQIGAEISEYKAKHIKGDLGFKLSDFNAVYRASQLEVEDRDALVDVLREGFRALGIGAQLDWVAEAERADAAAE